MPNLKAFVSKMKAKSAEYSAKQNEKNAKAKGFSSFKAMEFYSNNAKAEGAEKAKSELRKKHLKKSKDEAYQDKIQGRSGKYRKYQKKIIKGMESVQKGAGVYNEVMSEMKSLGGGQGDNSFYSNQPQIKKYKKKGNKRKPQKTKSKSRNKKPDFWSQFY